MQPDAARSAANGPRRVVRTPDGLCWIEEEVWPRSRAELTEALVEWLVGMDEPEDEFWTRERQTVTLTEITRRAKEAVDADA